MRHRHGKTIKPVSKDLRAHHATHGSTVRDTTPTDESTPAVELIRRKVQAIYAEEPDAKEEAAEVIKPTPNRSKHQEYMFGLTTSGKSLAQIQTEWHNYYLGLPDHEKHEVWREFYQNNNRQPSAYATYVDQQAAQQPATPAAQPVPTVSEHHRPAEEHAMRLPALPKSASSRKRATAATKHIKKRIVNKVLASESAQLKAKQHLHSLVFGVSTGLLVLLIFLFSFFNEMIIAPFIQPSRHVSATPLILNSDSISASDTPEVIIPKINVQIPVVYDEPSIEEKAVQRALERGVIHYATTVQPGQQGNAVLFGHSSNNIFNKGQYKFAFVLLHELVPGDIFYLTYNKQVYTYKVYDKKIVAPSEVSVVGNVVGKGATATLITCDPPGTSTNRLVVWGEQISPDPSGAAVPETPTVNDDSIIPTQLPSEGPTMWGRFWNWVF